MKKTNLSRRSFLGIGATASVLVGASLVGCSSDNGGSANDSNASAADLVWTGEADAIICGCGAAGVAAAIEVTEAGGSAILLEKAEAGGGSTRISGGLVYCGGGTRIQKACGLEDSVDNMKAYVHAVTQYSGGDRELVDLYCEESVNLFNWLEAHGVEFDEEADTEGYNVLPPNGISLEYSGNERSWEYAQIATPVPRGHAPHHDDEIGASAALFDPLLVSAESFGTEVVYNAEATELIQDADNRVIGVYAVIDGETVAFKANKGVILTTGAFTYNDEMIADYCPSGLIAQSKTGIPNDMGTGIKMGMKVGAGLRSMGVGNLSRYVYLYGMGPTRGVLVDKRGVRFTDESGKGPWIGRAIFELSPEKAYLIIDNEMMQDLHPTFGAALVPVAEANSIDELAGVLELESKTLTATIDRYNMLAIEGDDVDFHKASNLLAPVATPPFYAVDYSGATCGFFSLGGLKINENAEVLDIEGSPIPGLYSAGRNACAIFGNYPGSGNSIAEAFMFGCFAGRSIVAQ